MSATTHKLRKSPRFMSLAADDGTIPDVAELAIVQGMAADP